MSKYQKSIIYKIFDNTNGNVYYGSTYNLLRVRMRCHRSDAKHNLNKASQQIILNGNYDYSMVEKYPCNSKQELHTRERYWIENFECINKYVPGRTDKERKEYLKMYNAEYQVEYYIKNKEEIDKRKSTKIVCECGTKIRRNGISSHRKTPKHSKFMALICPPCPPLSPPPSPP